MKVYYKEVPFGSLERDDEDYFMMPPESTEDIDIQAEEDQLIWLAS